MLENYAKTVKIEARTLSEMLTKDFLLALDTYAGQTAKHASFKKAFLPSLPLVSEEALVTKLTNTYTELTEGIAKLMALVEEADQITDMYAMATFCQKNILGQMETLRLLANAAEALIPDELLPYPTYDQLLFSL